MTGPYPVTPDDAANILLPSVAEGLGITVEEALLLEQRLQAAETESDLVRLVVETTTLELPVWADWIATEVVDGI